MSRRPGWVSASELAEYAYCPRAHWYSGHPPPGGPAPDARRRSEAGQRYHRATLGAEERREAHGGAYVALLVIGALVVIGGFAWLLFR